MKRWLLFLALAAAAFFPAARGSATPTPQLNLDAARQLTIPNPDLSALDETVRSKIETVRNGLEQGRQRPGISPRELAEGFGMLGQVYQAAELLDAAAVCYTNAGMLAADDHRWPYLRGLIHNLQGDFERAIGDYEKTLTLDAEGWVTHLRLGNALLELGRPEEARKRLERAHKLAGDNPAVLGSLGQAAVALGEAEPAVEYLERALTLEPEATALHYPLAQAYRKLGRSDLARQHLEQRGDQQPLIRDRLAVQVSMIGKTFAFEAVRDLARDPSNFSELDFLGFVLTQFAGMEGVSDSLATFLEQLAISGEAGPLERGRLHYALAGLLVNENRDELAIEHFQRAVELDPGLRDARIKLGNALARQQRFVEAVVQYDHVLVVDADHAEALSQRAAARTNLGRLRAAREDLERLVALAPDSREAHLRLASVLEQMDEGEAAVTHLVRAIELASGAEEKAATHVRFATYLRGQGKYRSAAEQYQAAQIVDPEHVPAFLGMASLLASLGRYRDAAAVYRRLVTLRPESVEARMGEATALILAGEHRAARDRLEEGLAVLPDNVNFRDVLARHLAACPDRSIRDGPRALELATALYGEVPTPESMETLAMAYAEAGQFEAAVEWQRKLIAAVRDQADAEGLGRLEGNLALYLSRQRCCVR